MRALSTLGAGVSGLGLLLVIASSDASSASPRRIPAVPALRAFHTSAGRAPLLRPRGSAATPVPCTTDATPSFVGITSGVHDFAGDASGVPSGFENIACDADDGILSGESNAVGTDGTDGNADWSSIGGGENNDITAQYGFIGSGLTNSISGAYSFIGSGDGGTASGVEAFVGAGISATASGNDSFVGAGQENTASGNSSFVGAGTLVSASGIASFLGAGGSEYRAKCGGCEGAGSLVAAADAFLGAGDLNAISSAGAGSFLGAGGYAWAADGNKTPSNQIAAEDSFLGAGDANTVSGALGFLGSGEYNTIASTASYAAIAGGYSNTESATDGFVGSGAFNSISSAGAYATILGGGNNTVSAEYASILGGYGSTASGSYAIVAGGNSDTAAGILSFAAGYHADAAHNGSFVWSDYSSGSAMVKDTAANQFVVRASGGTTVYSNEAATSGVMLTPGSGSWASLSDRNAKTDIVALDDDSILAKVAALPIDGWRYKSEKGVRHVGPMAQDFYAAFGTGVDNRHITSIDEDGVALAAIKALHREIGELKDKNASLQSELTALAARIDGHATAKR